MRKHHETVIGIVPALVAAAPIVLGISAGVVIKIKNALNRKDGQQ